MNIVEKRKKIATLERNARRKIARLKAKGVTADMLISFRDAKNVARYNTKQADSYIQRLEQFNSRKTGFVQLGNGKWIPKEKWLAYKDAEARANKSVRNLKKRFEKMPSPNKWLTMAELRQMTVEGLVSQGRKKMPSPSDIHEVHRKPHSIRSESALGKLERKYREQLTAEGRKRKVEGYRRTIKGLLDFVEPSLSSEIDSLTDEQIRKLWVYQSSFAQELALWYLMQKAKMEGEREGVYQRYWDGVSKNSKRNVLEGLEWIKTQRGTRKKRKSRKR